LHLWLGEAKVGPEIGRGRPSDEGSGMTADDEFAQSKRHQYALFTRLLFWVVAGTFLTMAALAVIFF
jgi:hypothetical protein